MSSGKCRYPAQRLQSNGIKHLDLLIVTNFDEDHVSGVPILLDNGITVACALGKPTHST